MLTPLPSTAPGRGAPSAGEFPLQSRCAGSAASPAPRPRPPHGSQRVACRELAGHISAVNKARDMLRDELGRFRHSALIAASSGGGTRAGQMCLGAAGPNCSHLSSSPAARSAQPGNAAVTSWSRRVAGSIVAPPRGPARDQSDTLRGETGRCSSGAGDPGLRVSPRPPWASCRSGRDRAVPASPQATRPGPGTPLGPEGSTRRRGWRCGSRQGSQRAPAKAARGVSLPCPSSFCPNLLATLSLIPFHPSPCISSYLSSSMSFSPLLTRLLSPLRYISPISPSCLLRLPSGPAPFFTLFAI